MTPGSNLSGGDGIGRPAPFTVQQHTAEQMDVLLHGQREQLSQPSAPRLTLFLLQVLLEPAEARPANRY